MTADERGAAVLAAIRSRRVVRAMTAEPVARADLEAVLDAARWAPTAGNRHLQRFVATDDPATLRVLRMVSPGMVQRPAAVVAICTDRPRAAAYGFPPDAPGLHVDVAPPRPPSCSPRTRSGSAPGRSRRSAGPRWRLCCGCPRGGCRSWSSASGTRRPPARRRWPRGG
ncbi:hypothetical protein BJF78_23515 [Pseudonocardia sp. CNS-139]|nr:hypothetical protein BJF78_23515 [Pseudonocardia sp. CNS-139]